jgi:acyl-CoA reductase-like NAD-dependent aldehyde dehydrogenase
MFCQGKGKPMPHGGVKQSGHGKDIGIYPLEMYTRIQRVMATHG